MNKLIARVRDNAIALVALLFALSGGYAIAATTTGGNTISACANQQTGELFLHTHGRCKRGQRTITWNQAGPQGAQGAPGAPAISTFGVVNYDGSVFLGQSEGIVPQRTGTGTYQVTIAGNCAKGANSPTISVTQAGSPSVQPPPSGAFPVGWIEDSSADETFTVHTGYQISGAFSPADLRFDLQDSCRIGNP